MAHKKQKTTQYYEGLGPSQLKAFGTILRGSSVFLTGSAGTGKSELLKRLVQYWDSIGLHYGLTASTGIAAMNIGGRTLHSFVWLRPDDEDLEVHEVYARLAKVPSFRNYKYTLNKLKALVIDEVSMISPKFLDLVSALLKLVRSNGAPFGGIQVILVGDFFQLSPVKSLKLLFETPLFYETVQERLELVEVWRQSDMVFIDLLSRMRQGQLLDSDIALLQSRVGHEVTKFGIRPTELWSTNKDVDRLNSDALSQIKTPSVYFEVLSGIQASSAKPTDLQTMQLQKFVKDLGLLVVEVKGPSVSGASVAGPSVVGPSAADQYAENGAQVMLTYNLNAEKGLVNGSRGLVIGFECAPGGYAEDFFKEFLEPETHKAYRQGLPMPKVRFLTPSGKLEVLVPYVRYTRTSGTAEHKCTLFVWSMPLKLAWATTVHKSQGQSLDCVKVSLDRTVFAEGQAYVAVSRARSLEGLTLTAFDPTVVRASEKVKQFYSLPFGTQEIMN